MQRPVTVAVLLLGGAYVAQGAPLTTGALGSYALALVGAVMLDGVIDSLRI
jgi:hypothetical protein